MSHRVRAAPAYIVTLDDLKKAAENHGMEVENTADNIYIFARDMKKAGKIS